MGLSSRALDRIFLATGAALAAWVVAALAVWLPRAGAVVWPLAFQLLAFVELVVLAVGVLNAPDSATVGHVVWMLLKGVDLVLLLPTGVVAALTVAASDPGGAQNHLYVFAGVMLAAEIEALAALLVSLHEGPVAYVLGPTKQK